MNFYKALSIVMIMALATSCQKAKLIDLRTNIPSEGWAWKNKPSYTFEVTDTAKAYNLYFDLRHTANYKYSNIWITLYNYNPGMAVDSQKLEFRLATPEGAWLGDGLGDVVSHQIPIQENIKFPKKGTYKIAFGQEMRDNPLAEIKDVGVTVSEVE